MSPLETLSRCATLCDRAFKFSGGFFEARGSQSMVRGVALLLALAGAACAGAAYGLAQRPHVTSEHVAMVNELTKLAAVFVAGGAVALLTRTRASALPHPQDGA